MQTLCSPALVLGKVVEVTILSFHNILTSGEDGACEIQDGRHHFQGLNPGWDSDSNTYSNTVVSNIVVIYVYIELYRDQLLSCAHTHTQELPIISSQMFSYKDSCFKTAQDLKSPGQTMLYCSRFTMVELMEIQ